ncbi:hypothetical protein BC829DRAFT_150001 [Chytridium lagenaria]|nr:hypothetical protein BC829DRAFT_150001 [Chytridium lagenaria]
MRTCKKSMEAVSPSLWKGPQLLRPHHLTLFTRTIQETKVYQTLNYASMIDALTIGVLPISDNDLFDILTRCTNITQLIVQNNSISSTSLSQVVGSQKLTTLNIAGCEKVEMNVFVNRLVQGPSPTSPTPTLYTLSLQHVNLSRTRLSNGDVENLLSHFTSLTSLRITGCKSITDESLVIISKHGVALQELSFSECLITNTGISHLLNPESVCRLTLKHVEASKTLISVSSVVWMLRKLVKLETLVIKDCPVLHGRTPSQHVQTNVRPLRLEMGEEAFCENLRALTLDGRCVEDEHLAPLLRYAKKLEKVSLGHTSVREQTCEALNDMQFLEVIYSIYSLHPILLHFFILFPFLPAFFVSLFFFGFF